MTDPIADMLTRIRNANRNRAKEVSMPSSKMKQEIAKILKEEGFVEDYKVEKNDVQDTLTLTLKYANKERVITGLKRISKPGLRVYAQAEELPRVLNGLGIAIISTPKGIMTDKMARKNQVGGEVIAYIW
jgi:small subunit ribosomal protein S8